MSALDCYHCGETITSGQIVIDGCTYCDAICAAGAGKVPIPTDEITSRRRAVDDSATLATRVADLRAWARTRLDICDRALDEAADDGANVTGDELTAERRTLRAVIRILDGGAT